MHPECVALGQMSLIHACLLSSLYKVAKTMKADGMLYPRVSKVTARAKWVCTQVLDIVWK